MSDIEIRRKARAGRITLNRPEALNALTYDMITRLEAALKDWAADDGVALVLIDAAGDKAFCAGGDIAELYRTGRAGDFTYGQRFWRDEYRMNALLAGYGKPVVTFLQGFTMGGGVGVGCHAATRIVGDTSRIAMPECGIGLVPDVGGSLLLARAPGRLGDYLGLTGARMGPGDAIYAGFADLYVAETEWPTLIAQLCRSGAPDAAIGAATPLPPVTLAARQAEIDALLAPGSLTDIVRRLREEGGPFAQETLDRIARNAPLSMACTLEMLSRLRVPDTTIAEALALEYRFTARAMQRGDFLEGIRAAIIDKDRTPRWKHALDGVTRQDVKAMLAPLQEELQT